MLFSRHFLLFPLSPFVGTSVCHPNNPGVGIVPRESDAQILDQFAQTGLCMGYMGNVDLEKKLKPCRTWCQKPENGGNADGVGCLMRSKGQEGFDESMIKKDEAGNPWIPGKCTCVVKDIVMPILETVMKGLANLDKVICAVMLTALTTIAEYGLQLIPGGQTLVAAKYAVQGAKSFVENGLEVASFFGNWVGKACGVPEFKFDTMDVFNKLAGAPDWMGSSIGCKRNKAECKALPPANKKGPPEDGFKGDPKKPGSDRDKTKENAPDKTTGKPDDKPSKSQAPTPSNQGVSTPSPGASRDLTKSATSGSDLSTRSNSKGVSDASKATSERPSTTRSDRSTITSSQSNAACRIRNRAAADETVTRKWLDPETRTSCVNNIDEVHITHTPKESVGWYTTDVPVVCEQKCAQACYNYRSIISVHTKTEDMHRFTCQKHPNLSKHGKATANWGSTRLAKRAKTAQHWWPWANGFVTLSVGVNTKGDTIYKGCERDEWPPRYFWPGEAEAAKRNMVQRIRFIPYHDNSCGGQYWNGFCAKNNARGLDQDDNELVRSQFIKIKSEDRSPKKNVGKDGVTTFSSTVSIDTARAVFTFDDKWDGLPKDADDGLWLNTKCWPSDLAPKDPGWALLTSDEWYETQHKELQDERSKYTQTPELASIQAALAKHGGRPEYEFKAFRDEAEFIRKIGRGLIPDSHRILPGVPALPGAAAGPAPAPGVAPPPPPPPPPVIPPKFLRRQWTNGTVKGWVIDEPEDEDDGDVDDYTSDKMRAWLNEYVALMKRAEEESRPRRPRDTPAVPTVAGEGGSGATRAVERSVATAEMPQFTGNL